MSVEPRAESQGPLHGSVDSLGELDGAVPQIVWIARANGSIEHATPRWTELTGAASGAPPDGVVWFSLLHTQDAASAEAAWSAAVHSRGAFQRAVRILNRNNGATQRVSVLAWPLHDSSDGEPRWVGAVVDPRQADSSRRKDEFLAVLAHELRNPLAPIRNWVTVMRDGASDPLRQKEAFEVIDRQLDRLTRLVDDLLDAARISEGKLRIRSELFELGPAILAAVQVVEHEVAGRGHRLRVELPSEALLVEADPVRFEQILVNLLGNAARYTENGGELAVIARNAGGELILTVKDNGIGIPTEMLSQIFEPYTQVDASWRRHHGGLGIGLAVVRSLVAMHGGVVEAQSDGVNRGSEFIVRMPIARGEAEAESEATPDARSPATVVSGGRRVLVVDDNEDSAFSLSLLLQARGHDVRLVHDGPSAIALSREWRPEVVLLDLGLPGMDGCEVARRLRAQPETQLALLVAVTGYAHDEAREKARAAGFDHHLVKPVALPELLAVISIR